MRTLKHRVSTMTRLEYLDDSHGAMERGAWKEKQSLDICEASQASITQSEPLMADLRPTYRGTPE